jgi:hypothetical protein
MSESKAPKIPKWPFIVGDVVLLLTAVLLLNKIEGEFGMLEAFWCLACVGGGAWIMALPFLKEFQAQTELTEVRELAASVDKVDSLEMLLKRVENATEQWLHVEDRANEINVTSKDISDKINAEAREFSEFLQKANDTEKNHLRLEVEKLGKSQNDWLQVLTATLDHVFALTQAGRQSGQDNLIKQLNAFQMACREVARRVGLVAHEIQPGELFDANKHQLRDSKAEPKDGSNIVGVAAQGLSFQGRLIRKTVVVLDSEDIEDDSKPKPKPKPKAKKKA